MVHSSLSISSHNLRWLRVISFTRALYFSAAIWIQWELKFITFDQVLAIESIIQMAQIGFELPTGAIADLFGRRVSVALGFGMTAVSYVFTALAASYAGFLVMAISFALAESLVSGAMDALIYDSLKEDGREATYARVNSQLSLIFQLGLAIATVVGGVLGGIDLRIPIYMAVVSFAITAVLTLMLREPHIGHTHRSLGLYVKQIGAGVREITKSFNISLLSLFYILYGAVTWMCTITYSQSLMVDLGYSPSEIGISVGIMRLLNGVLLYQLIKHARWLTAGRVYILLPIVIVIALIPGAWLTKWWAIPAVGLMMIASSARWNLLGQYTNDHFSSRNRATAISALSMGVAIIYVVFNTFIGTPLYSVGRTPFIFTALGVMGILLVLPLGIYLARKKI